MAPGEAGLTVLHQADDLTVLHVVWAPGMDIWPHDHRMWAVIGIYEGEEDNTFYRRGGPDSRSLTASGGKRITKGDTLLLGRRHHPRREQPSARPHRRHPRLRRRPHRRASQPVGSRPSRGAPVRHRPGSSPVRRSQRVVAGRQFSAVTTDDRVRLREVAISRLRLGYGWVAAALGRAVPRRDVECPRRAGDAGGVSWQLSHRDIVRAIRACSS